MEVKWSSTKPLNNSKIIRTWIVLNRIIIHGIFKLYSPFIRWIIFKLVLKQLQQPVFSVFCWASTSDARIFWSFWWDLFGLNSHGTASETPAFSRFSLRSSRNRTHSLGSLSAVHQDKFEPELIFRNKTCRLQILERQTSYQHYHEQNLVEIIKQPKIRYRFKFTELLGKNEKKIFISTFILKPLRFDSTSWLIFNERILILLWALK